MLLMCCLYIRYLIVIVSLFFDKVPKVIVLSNIISFLVTILIISYFIIIFSRDIIIKR
jgi:hypothetical protein